MLFAKLFGSKARSRRASAVANRTRQRLAIESLEQRLALATLNNIELLNQSGLNPADYTVWVAGFMQVDGSATNFQVLQPDGSFSAGSAVSSAPFINVNAGLTVQVPDVTNSGNNRLVFAVTDATAPAPSYPITGYTAYPFPAVPGVSPPGPYDIFEFGPNAQYDVSAVDSLGINLSFTVAGDSYTYGVQPSVTRHEIQESFKTFMAADPYGADFTPLLYTSPSGAGYPDQIDNQFTAIVSPKDWVAINSSDPLSTYWNDTINALFSAGNQFAFYLNAATVGQYTGVVDPTGSFITVNGTDSNTTGITVEVPKSDFNSMFSSNSNPFGQYVRAPNQTSYDNTEYAVFSQLEANIFMAISRGVVLDGVKPAGQSAPLQTYTSDAWTNVTNWYKGHINSYNGQSSKYDAFAKFMHYGKVDGNLIYGQNSGRPDLNYPSFGMAYGFSLDENPGMGSSTLLIPPAPSESGSWPNSLNVPSKKLESVGSQQVTLTIGPWGSPSTTSLSTVSGDFDGNGLTDIADFKATGQWEVALTPTTGNPTTVNAGSPWSATPTWSDFTVIRDTTTSRDVVIARASNAVDGSWWKLSYDGTTWNTTFVGSWGIPDQWVNIVSGDFDGNGKTDIAGRWELTGEWWILKDAATPITLPVTIAKIQAKNVLIGQWNPAATWTKVVSGNFTGNASGKDTIAGLEGSKWWLLERTGSSSTNTLMTSAWSAAHTWLDYQVGNFTGATNGQEQIAARSGSSGAWHRLGKSGSSYAISSMSSWNPAATWLNVVSGDFNGNGTTDIAGRNAATSAWTVLRKSSGTPSNPIFTNADFGGAWPTSSVWGKAFAGIYNQQAGSPKKFGILGRSASATTTWEKALPNAGGTAFTSSAAPGYPS